MDQGLFTAPHGLSQCTTSFIASCCQGIHQTPFSRLIRSGKSKAAFGAHRLRAALHSQDSGAFCLPRHAFRSEVFVHFPPRANPGASGIPRDAGGQCTRLGIASCLPGPAVACRSRAGSSALGRTDTKLMCISLNDVKPAPETCSRAVRPKGRSRGPRGASR